MADVVYDLHIMYCLKELADVINTLTEDGIERFLNHWFRPVLYTHPISKFLVYIDDYSLDDWEPDDTTMEFEYNYDNPIQYDRCAELYDRFRSFAGKKLFALIRGHPELMEAMIKLRLGTDDMVSELFEQCITPQDYRNLQVLIALQGLKVDDRLSVLISERAPQIVQL